MPIPIFFSPTKEFYDHKAMFSTRLSGNIIDPNLKLHRPRISHLTYVFQESD
jgi:hypothetical protein